MAPEHYSTEQQQPLTKSVHPHRLSFLLVLKCNFCKSHILDVLSVKSVKIIQKNSMDSVITLHYCPSFLIILNTILLFFSIPSLLSLTTLPHKFFNSHNSSLKSTEKIFINLPPATWTWLIIYHNFEFGLPLISTITLVYIMVSEISPCECSTIKRIRCVLMMCWSPGAHHPAVVLTLISVVSHFIRSCLRTFVHTAKNTHISKSHTSLTFPSVEKKRYI